MNTGALIFRTTCAEAVAAPPVLPKSSHTSNTNPFAPPLDHTKSLTDTPEVKTTDNNPAVAQGRPVTDPPQNFRDALRKKVEPKPGQQDQAKAEPKTQNAESEGVPGANGAQLAVAQKMATGAASAEQGVTAGMNNSGQHQVAAKTHNMVAKLVASPQSLNSATIKAGELSPQAPKTENGLLLVARQGEPDLKAASPQQPYNMMLAANTQSGKNRNAATAHPSNKAFAATASGSDQQSGGQIVTKLPGPLTKTNDGHATTPLPGAKLPVPEANADQPHQKLLVGQGKSGLIPESVVDKEQNTNRQQPHAVWQKLADAKSAQIPSSMLSGTVKGQAKDASGGSKPLNLNLTHIQTSTVQIKEQSNSTTDNSPNPDLGHMLSHNNQVQVVEQSSFSSQVAKTPSDTSANNDVSANIAAQIEEHFHTTLQNGDRHITIRLYPPELGRVFVSLQEQEDQIIGLLEVSKAQTRYEIEQALPQIIQHLQESGVDIKRLEVVLTDQHEQEAYKDQSLQDGLFQPHGSSQQDSHTDNTNANSWLTNDDGYQNIAEPQVQVTDNSINMLV